MGRRNPSTRASGAKSKSYKPAPASRTLDDNEVVAFLRSVPDMTKWYEETTIQNAMKGDVSAGLEALRLFIASCDAGNISPRLLAYITERFAEIVFRQVEPAVALKLFERKGRGKEYPELEVAACYFLLRRNGCTPGTAKTNLQQIFVSGGKSISSRAVEIIAKSHAPMANWDHELLLNVYHEMLPRFSKEERKLIAKLISQKAA
ncbi:MAG: hypothetical protein ACKVQA_03315 [Burkholderiales bacterium]